MFGPRDLLRSDSLHNSRFAAPVDILRDSEIDYGIATLPCVKFCCCRLEKFATRKIFTAVLALVGFLQGASLYYFRHTSENWATYFNISQESADWLKYVNEFFVGVLALLVSYWGNRTRRILWTFSLTILLSISAALLTIPEIRTVDVYAVKETVGVSLCNVKQLEHSGEIDYLAISILVGFQVVHASAFTSFITHGLTYLDDNTDLADSSAYIGIIIATHELGKQAGIYLAGIPFVFNLKGTFASATWIIITIKIFISGCLISTFPSVLPSEMMKKATASIIQIARGEVPTISRKIIDGFWKSLWRLVKNQILMTSILSAVLLQSALIGFDIFEKHFNQSRFGVGFKSKNAVDATVNWLKQPMVVISVIATGMTIAKMGLELKTLVKWNIVCTILVILFFSSSAFFNCEHDDSIDDYKSRPNCSKYCTCALSEFHPICMGDNTMSFSPCHAGCQTLDSKTNVYGNCTCGNSIGDFPGYCSKTDKCNMFFTISQANRIIYSAILASTYITSLMINLRCIISRDKALALGLQATFVGVVPYLPLKAIYNLVADKLCSHRDEQKCLVFSKNFGLFLATSTVSLMLFSLVVSIITLVLLKSYAESETADVGNENGNNATELQTLNPGNNGMVDLLNSQDSLYDELRSVGDDHDSVN